MPLANPTKTISWQFAHLKARRVDTDGWSDTITSHVGYFNGTWRIGSLRSFSGKGGGGGGGAGGRPGEWGWRWGGGAAGISVNNLNAAHHLPNEPCNWFLAVVLTAGGSVCAVYTVSAMAHCAVSRGPVGTNSGKGAGHWSLVFRRDGAQSAQSGRLPLHGSHNGGAFLPDGSHPSFPLLPPSPSRSAALPQTQLCYVIAVRRVHKRSVDRDQRPLPSWSPRSLALLCQPVLPSGWEALNDSLYIHNAQSTAKLSQTAGWNTALWSPISLKSGHRQEQTQLKQNLFFLRTERGFNLFRA